MNLFGARQKQLLSFLTANAERETLDYVLQGMKEVLGDEMPEEDAVRAYLQDPDEPISLSTEQQIVALDKLLECAEVNLRTLCDLIRYQQLRMPGWSIPWRSSCVWCVLTLPVISKRRMLIERIRIQILR